jgi:multicomponent Na+:H+ antiporter subunit F
MVSLETILTEVLYISLVIHVVLMAVVARRVWRGENALDRLLAFELFGLLILAVLVLMSLITHKIIYIDAAFGLLALGFVATVALAKYLSDDQLF